MHLYYKPSIAHHQRLTYSPYHCSNCTKRSIHVQHCAWLGAKGDLFSGGISDVELFCMTIVQTMTTNRH